MKTKYGDNINFEDETSSSSEDDEDGVEFTEKVEKDFFKTLAYIKNKDPRIYDKNVQFFDNTQLSVNKDEKKKKEKPMFLKDYERKILLEKGGIVSDEEEDKDEKPRYDHKHGLYDTSRYISFCFT